MSVVFTQNSKSAEGFLEKIFTLQNSKTEKCAQKVDAWVSAVDAKPSQIDPGLATARYVTFLQNKHVNNKIFNSDRVVQGTISSFGGKSLTILSFIPGTTL